MNIVISNCNSIDEAKISAEEGRLNIKFGINGTGKSTIAKAIELNSISPERLKELTPFKYIEDNPDEILPSISIDTTDAIASVAVFNEQYINQFIFKQDELIKDSFAIFIKNKEYDKKIFEIENIISKIKNTFKNDENIDKVIADLSELSECFGNSKTGYSAAGSIGKGLGKGNKIENIPIGLEQYADYLKSDKNIHWIKWQIAGNNFIELSDKCPYCTAPTIEKKEEIKRVSDEYDAKSIEHLTKVLGVLERLSQYFSEDTRDKLFNITKNKIGLSKEEINYLKQVKEQIDTLKIKLTCLKQIAFSTFEDVDKVVDKIETLKINLSFLTFLDSQETNRIVDELNEALNDVLAQAGHLQGEVNKQKDSIRKTIDMYSCEINNFLRFAGYEYSVSIENDSEQYKLKLKHHDLSTPVTSGEQHLSFGEKNAFSLVLFMYECLSREPSLIILDDPISSFDRNKKFAIIEMLFRGQRSFKGKTVIMLTHDLEPIIDLVKNLPHIFEPVPSAMFLHSTGGKITETQITRDDILTFAQVCDNNVRCRNEIIIKLIFLRRFYEATDDKGYEYHLLSNLFHKRDVPIIPSDDKKVEMSEMAIKTASTSIKEKIPDFDYNTVLVRLKNRTDMLELYRNTQSNYEKLQIFRIINDNHGNNIIRKYINETYHIENEYLCQLDPCKFEMVPDFLIRECNASFE